jgi:hypothetical protein
MSFNKAEALQAAIALGSIHQSFLEKPLPVSDVSDVDLLLSFGAPPPPPWSF